MPLATFLLTCGVAASYYLFQPMRRATGSLFGKCPATDAQKSWWTGITILGAPLMSAVVYGNLSPGNVFGLNLLALMAAYIGIPLGIVMFYAGCRCVAHVFNHFYSACASEGPASEDGMAAEGPVAATPAVQE